MCILTPVMQEPTDIVLQGACIGDTPLGLAPQSREPWFVLGGEVAVSWLAGFPVPRALIGWNPSYAHPAEVGPMNTSGGKVVMQAIGPTVPNWLATIVDPIQRFLRSAMPLDATGSWMPEQVVLTQNAERPMGGDVWSNPAPFCCLAPPNNPRREVAESGLLKKLTAPNWPPDFGSYIAQHFVQTTTSWYVTGVTRNGAGAILGGCRVVLLLSGKIAYNFDQYANPVVAEMVSDAVTGAYSFQVAYPGTYQVWAYLVGAPDVAGVTREDVMAVANA